MPLLHSVIKGIREFACLFIVINMESSSNESIVNEKLNPSEPIDKNDNEIDPYAYLDRGDFSSENFKLELSNLPRKFGIAVRMGLT